MMECNRKNQIYYYVIKANTSSPQTITTIQRILGLLRDMVRNGAVNCFTTALPIATCGSLNATFLMGGANFATSVPYTYCNTPLPASKPQTRAFSCDQAGLPPRSTQSVETKWVMLVND